VYVFKSHNRSQNDLPPVCAMFGSPPLLRKCKSSGCRQQLARHISLISDNVATHHPIALKQHSRKPPSSYGSARCGKCCGCEGIGCLIGADIDGGSSTCGGCIIIGGARAYGFALGSSSIGAAFIGAPWYGSKGGGVIDLRAEALGELWDIRRSGGSSKARLD
jgi:hypothetical protein